MSAGEIGALIGLGLLAGVISGLLGVGGGVVFVPSLVIAAGLSQHVAEGTSLLAILPAVIAGTVSQRRYGNVRQKDALLIGALALGGGAAGVVLANELSGQVLRIVFATVMVIVALRLLRRALSN